MIPIFNSDPFVAQWVALRIGAPIDGPYTAIGIARDNRLVAGFVYFRNFGFSIDVAVAGEPGWATRGAMEILFRYPFRQLQVSRLGALVARSNHVSRRFCLRAGMRLEGVARRAFSKDEDAFVFSMLPHECKWLGEEHESRQGRKPIAAHAA